MCNEREQLEQAIAVLEAQRAILADAMVEAALRPMRDKLAALQQTKFFIDRTIYHGAYPEGTAIRFTSFELWQRCNVIMKRREVHREIFI